MNPTKRAFADVKRAPTIYSLHECPNGCGEMLALDDGWQCPICYKYLGYRRGSNTHETPALQAVDSAMMKHTIICGDVITGLRSLPDACVQCVVTSPPYWGLRDYDVEGQIGLEPTVEEYVQKLVEVFREVQRVLRDDGALWLNLGDVYSNETRVLGNPVSNVIPETGAYPIQISGKLNGKNLFGIPWRVAFALQADGWYLRSDVIWSKPNPVPEAVTDRPTRNHEYVFLLTKQPQYFYDAYAVRVRANANAAQADDLPIVFSPRGHNRYTVWEIVTQPTPYAHFATFPEALVEICIKAGSSERGCCPECGAPWQRIVESVAQDIPKWNIKSRGRKDCGYSDSKSTTLGARKTVVQAKGWQPTCTCGLEPIPCVILDPFSGSGTVAKVARDLGRSSISIELNREYVEITKRRLRINEQLDTGICEYSIIDIQNNRGGMAQ